MSEATAPAENTTTKSESLERFQQTGMEQVILEEKRFELAQRKANIYAKSSLVPKEYQNNIGNVLIAENMAQRMGADTLMVMQNLYIVHGKPGWSAVFLIGSFNSNGRFSAIKYRFHGERHTPDWGCQAFCTELSTGEEISGAWVTWEMANAEGWVNKNGSKWKTMPEQMFRYRAATFLIRSTAPEIGLGLLTKEELDDMEPQNGNGGSIADGTRSRIESLKEKLTEAPAAEPYFDATAEVLDDDEQPAPATVEEPAVPAPVEETKAEETAEASTEEEQPATDEKPLSKAESQKVDQIAWITEFEKESDDNAERVARLLEDRDLESSTPGQVKEIYLELQK